MAYLNLPGFLPVLLTDVDRVHVHAILEPARPLVDGHVVAAHLPLPHETVLGKRPVLEAVRPPPLAGRVVPFVPELHRDLLAAVYIACYRFWAQTSGVTDLVVRESEQLLPQTVALLPDPLVGQELHDFIAALQEGAAVAPDGIGRVAHLDLLRVPVLGTLSAVASAGTLCGGVGLPCVP